SVTEPGRPPARRLLQGPAQPRPDGSVVVPLRAPDRPAGALVLTPPEPVAATEWPPDVDLLTALGQQAGVALARAAMQDRSASVAHELQHALLTTDVPDDDRFGVTTIYRPGVQALEVGGDWYDVFLVRDGVLAVAVGDVVGRGLHAAAAMGQLRSAVRAVADEDGPVGVLARLDRFVERTGVGFMATLAYAELDLATGLVRYACAGHMPPLLLGEETTLLWEGRSLPLGVRGARTGREQGVVQLTGGDRLVLYTDGLVERRDQPLDEALAALVEAAGSLGGAPVNRLVSDAPAHPVGEHDDVCLLALTWFGPEVPGRADEA
ncbi:serine/threonine-protein phosphatase, partial [Actinotalea ferrariae]|uniref:PP2C family protein-serine/threonine phosphatase n=1 Tax=Actinotalea ferrariae TaxID=1386098 RepID=UPI001C8BD3EE